MKNLKHILLSGTTLFLSAFFAASCTDGNDWDVDPSYDRLFSVNSQKLTVDYGVDYAALEWTNTPNTDYYIIEVSKDSLTDQVEMGKSNGSIVYGEDKSITTSPDTIRGLAAGTKYFLRMKGLSTSGKGGSNWAYYSKYSFTTDKENIMEGFEPENVLANSATVKWDASKEVTRLGYVPSGETDTTFVTLSDAEKKNGSYTITGLRANKTYIVGIYNGDVQRGSTRFTTAADLPSGYDAVDITSVDVFNAVLTDPTPYIKNNGGNLILVFQPGLTIDNSSEDAKVTIPSTIKSIQFWGEAGGEKPTLIMKNVDFEGEHAEVIFKNLNIKSADGKGYVVNQKATGTVGNLKIEDCNLSDMAAVVRNQSSGSNFTNIIINNCVMNKVGVGYAVVENKQAASVMNSVSITNSTLSNSDTKGVVISSVQSPLQITIENCTFYNTLRASQYFIDDDAGKKGAGNVSVTLKKLVIGKSYNYAEGNVITATRNKGISSVTDVYTVKDFGYKAGYDFDGKTTILDVTSAELFVAPDEGDFHIQKGLITDAGDPRWLN